jgi:hypothetical protein
MGSMPQMEGLQGTGGSSNAKLMQVCVCGWVGLQVRLQVYCSVCGGGAGAVVGAIAGMCGHGMQVRV